MHAAVDDDLATRHALIADGHHRYATYRELQRELRTSAGPGPWDRGLALLVDSTAYGPQVHAIHRVLVGLPLGDALERVQRVASITAVDSAEAGLAELYDDVRVRRRADRRSNERDRARPGSGTGRRTCGSTTSPPS